MTSISLQNTGLFLIRMALGVIFIAHGAQKLFGAFGGPGIEQVTVMVKGLGFQPPLLWAYLLAGAEFFGGLLLLLGVIPRISAASIAFAMLVAIIKIHGANGLFAANQGFEYQLLILMTCLAIVLSGAGKISLFDKF